MENQTTENQAIGEVKVYLVLSIKTIRKMLRQSNKFSKSIYNGKINPISNDVFHLTVLMDEQYKNNGEYQAQLIGE